jgi:hypothetical protein
MDVVVLLRPGIEPTAGAHAVIAHDGLSLRLSGAPTTLSFVLGL